MECLFLQPKENMSSEEKIALIQKNIRTAQSIKKEISRLSTLEFVSAPEVSVKRKTKIEIPQKSEQEDVLYNQISRLSIEELAVILSDLLNGISESRIKEFELKLYREIIELSNTGLETGATIEEIRDLIQELQDKIKMLEAYMSESLEEELETDAEKNLFFLTTNNENVVAFESLRKEVPNDYYEDFLTIFTNLKKGNLKGIKRLKIRGIYEIKMFKIRVIFIILDKNNFVILDAFMKKYDTSKVYRERILKLDSAISQALEYYKDNKDNLAFQGIHNGYYDEIINLLTSERRLK